MKIEECNKPKYSKFHFSSDEPLEKKLEKIPLYNDLLNRFATTLTIGRQGQGKSSLVMNLLKDKDGYKGVFDHIYVFLPTTSQQNIKDSPYSKIPQEQIFDELNYENLEYVFSKINETAENNVEIEDDEEKERCLIIFDDVSSELKNKSIQQLLKRIIKNQRHLFVSSIYILQSYFDMPKQLRLVCNNLFLFKMSKDVMYEIFKELIEIPKSKYDELIQMVYNDNHDWLAINMNNKNMYSKFDRVILDEPI